jgi:plasmid maintenance system antidote protein VapI
MAWNFDPAIRLWPRVNKGEPDECWEWTGALTAAGYGLLTIRGKNHLAHRLAWELTNGPIPEGKHICHKCDNPACCNPSHLWAGSARDNVRDAAKKGRLMHGEGHVFSKLTDEDIPRIHELANDSNVSRREIAEQFGVTRATITDVIYGRTWKHIPVNRTVVNRGRGVHHPNAKLTPGDAQEIRTLYTNGLSQRWLAAKFSVSRGTVEAVIKGYTWKYTG